MKKCRDGIDGIDRKLVELLNQRAELAVQIGEIKKEQGKPVYDPRREASLMAKLLKLNTLLPDNSLKAIYREIISASRSLEKRDAVSYLGPEGTFTHGAALNLFGSSADFSPAGGFSGVFNDVERSVADYGVIPLENSIEGSVNLTLDLLASSSLYITRELSLPAEQNLLSHCKKIGDIKKLYSHPQPLGQCKWYLQKKLQGVRVVEVYSTAEAARRAAKEKGTAALASLTAAKIYGLPILEKNVQDEADSHTRFVVLERSPAAKPLRGVKSKTSIAVGLKNRAGALHKLLGIFMRRKINLTKVVSRPQSDTRWGYLFYIDIDGHNEDKKVAEALKEVGKMSEQLKLFGSYPQE